MKNFLIVFIVVYIFYSCQKNPEANNNENQDTTQQEQIIPDTIKEKLANLIILEEIQLANEKMEKGEISAEQNKSKLILYLEEKPNETQLDELQKLGVNCYTELWTPATKTHPLGFFIAEVPNDKLFDLLNLEYIKKVDTAEKETYPDFKKVDKNQTDIQSEEPKEISVLGAGTAIVSMKLLSYSQDGNTYTCKVKILKNKGTGPATPTLNEGAEVTVTINENMFTTKNTKESVLNVGNTIKANIQHEPIKDGGKSSNIWELIKFN
ncbi:MAG: hypothetical protein JW866_04745 [Ignavibacteriales bacterium]|nr:hypothetical protein [Ignavibacteriales bacterium]